MSKGIKHYGKGGTYNMFAGRDASRAFVTGDFQEEGLLDDVTDLETSTFSGIKEWADFYEREYRRIGRVTGTYFDSNGYPTAAYNVLQDKYKQVDVEEESRKHLDQQYPLCNSEWSQEQGVTKFWCTDTSGGIKRSWVGVPRELFIPGTRHSRCACVDLEKKQHGEPGIVYDEPEDPLVQEYEGCDPKSSECFVKELDDEGEDHETHR